MYKVSRSLIAILILFTISTSASADKMFLSGCTQMLYDAKSGMEANDVNDVLQTRDGYIWIASYKGLIRYDGDKFVRYDRYTSKEFTAVSAMCLYEDANSKLWIGTNESGLYCLDNGRFRKIPDLCCGEFGVVRSIISDSKGNVFIGSSCGVGSVTKNGIKRSQPGRHGWSFYSGARM
jgi:energy-coupling factor transport system substrate-specific component